MSSRLDLLTDRYNELRNAAMGRGLKPNVSETVADIVGDQYDAFRAWRAGWGNTPGTDYLDGVPHDIFSGELRTWEVKYNATRTIVANELGDSLVPPEVPVGSAIERAAVDTAEAVQDIAKKAATGGAVLAGLAVAAVVGVLAYKLGSKKGR